jgi:alpha-1,2-mannosyltransferase
MTNFFRRIRPENPVVRNNYFIQVDDNLAWSESIGPEDSEGIGWFTAVSAPGQRRYKRVVMII